MLLKCSRNSVELHANCNRNEGKIWMKCGQNAVEMRSKFSQNAVEMQSKYGQNAVKSQSKFSQNSVKIRSTFQSKFSQNAFKIQSVLGVLIDWKIWMNSVNFKGEEKKDQSIKCQHFPLWRCEMLLIHLTVAMANITLFSVVASLNDWKVYVWKKGIIFLDLYFTILDP